MYVKMIGAGVPDDATPTFRLWQQVQGVHVFNAFHGEKPIPGVYKVELDFEDAHRLTVDVTGNVYVLNDQGKTIESFVLDLHRLILVTDEAKFKPTTTRMMPDHLRGQKPVSDRGPSLAEAAGLALALPPDETPGVPKLVMEVALTTERVPDLPPGASVGPDRTDPEGGIPGRG